MILISHPTGNENVRQAALAFSEAGLLEEFWTTLCWNKQGAINRLLPRSIQRTLARRSLPDAVSARTRTIPFRELGRLLSSAAGVPLFAQHETGFFSIDQVSRSLDRKVAAHLRRGRKKCSLVYAYEDAALRTFEAAAEREILRCYDLPIGYWRAGQQIFQEERERVPEWAATLTGVRDSSEKLARKEAELKLAERVVVASSFTRETLRSADCAAPVSIIPYGAPEVFGGEIPKSAGKLKVLFVGALGQRKGLSYLLDALEQIGARADLTLLGRKTATGCQPLETATRRHRWIPTMNHNDVLAEMRGHDVLVFPSLFEGFGLVILEAMSQGTPVITTSHTAGPDFIEDGVDGFIVPIRSAEAIAAKLDLFASDPLRLHAMKLAARRKAQLRTWETYRQQLAQMARDMIAK
jgi:starch synthase